MKLASLKSGRDGQLVVVNRALTHAVRVANIAPTLQQALENWRACAPKLQEIYQALNAGPVAEAFALDMTALASPLPRAYQWLDGSVYLSHVRRVRKSRGVEMPATFLTDPLMYQGASDGFLAPTDPIPLKNPGWGLDLEAEVAVITSDVPMGTTEEAAEKHILLVVLVNDISLRELAMQELPKGFGFVQCKPANAYTPIAVTPDELGDAWQDAKVHLPLHSYINGKQLGHPNAGEGMQFSFAKLIAHAAMTRNLSAGTIIGSGTVSNEDESVGCGCLIEKRTLEVLNEGAARTPYLQAGDTVKIEMLDMSGQSIFGAIEQAVQSN